MKKTDYEKPGMTFGQALEMVKAGAKVSRRGWNGKGMFIYMQGGSEVEVSKLKEQPLSAVKLAHGDHLPETIKLLPHIDMWTHDSSGREAILCGWLASQSDMLSNDWEVVGC